MIDSAPAMALGLFLGGAGVWAVMRARLACSRDDADLWRQSERTCSKHFDEVAASLVLCDNALSSCQRRLDAIRDLLRQPKTIRKAELLAVLDGEAANER